MKEEGGDGQGTLHGWVFWAGSFSHCFFILLFGEPYSSPKTRVRAGDGNRTGLRPLGESEAGGFFTGTNGFSFLMGGMIMIFYLYCLFSLFRLLSAFA